MALKKHVEKTKQPQPKKQAKPQPSSPVKPAKPEKKPPAGPKKVDSRQVEPLNAPDAARVPPRVSPSPSKGGRPKGSRDSKPRKERVDKGVKKPPLEPEIPDGMDVPVVTRAEAAGMLAGAIADIGEALSQTILPPPLGKAEKSTLAAVWKPAIYVKLEDETLDPMTFALFVTGMMFLPRTAAAIIGMFTKKKTPQLVSAN